MRKVEGRDDWFGGIAEKRHIVLLLTYSGNLKTGALLVYLSH